MKLDFFYLFFFCLFFLIEGIIFYWPHRASGWSVLVALTVLKVRRATGPFILSTPGLSSLNLEAKLTIVVLYILLKVLLLKLLILKPDLTDFYLQMMECVNVLLCSILASLDWCSFILLVCIVCVLLFIDLFYFVFCLTQCNCVCLVCCLPGLDRKRDFFFISSNLPGKIKDKNNNNNNNNNNDNNNNYAIGAVHKQWVDGAWQPLAFFSRQLTPRERKYSMFDRELLGLWLAIRHLRFLLEGQEFAAFVDQKPLTFCMSKVAEPWSARQQHQLSYISEYTTDIHDTLLASPTWSQTASPEQSSELSNWA